MKQEFDPVKSYGTTTGAGVIVDGETKLPVRIKNFDGSAARIPQGTFLQVVGVVTTNASKIIYQFMLSLYYLYYIVLSHLIYFILILIYSTSFFISWTALPDSGKLTVVTENLKTSRIAYA